MKIESQTILRKTFCARNKTRKRYPEKYQNISKYIKHGFQSAFMASELDAHGFHLDLDAEESEGDDDDNNDLDSTNDEVIHQSTVAQMFVSPPSTSPSFAQSMVNRLPSMTTPTSILPPISELGISDSNKHYNIH
jgi:hypothetical protein